MIIKEFKKIRRLDLVDAKYNNWSRIYEYPAVLHEIQKFSKEANPKIHNTSWGWEGCHVMFKDDLNSFSSECLHSDLKSSTLPKTTVWNLTTPPLVEWKDSFDFVINISTVEEVNFDHLTIIKNLLYQVKPGGILAITFDLPGLQLEKIEDFVQTKLQSFDDNITGTNSDQPNNRYAHLTCGLLVIEK